VSFDVAIPKAERDRDLPLNYAPRPPGILRWLVERFRPDRASCRLSCDLSPVRRRHDQSDLMVRGVVGRGRPRAPTREHPAYLRCPMRSRFAVLFAAEVIMQRFNPSSSHPARAVQCWQILVGKAMNRQTVTYEGLSDSTGSTCIHP
jgi:hypothetical protein